jgi:hypothetical protein
MVACQSDMQISGPLDPAAAGLKLRFAKKGKFLLSFAKRNFSSLSSRRRFAMAQPCLCGPAVARRAKVAWPPRLVVDPLPAMLLDSTSDGLLA